LVTLSLDTNVFVELIRQRNANVRQHFDHARVIEQPLVASLLVLQELYSGAERHHQPAAQREIVRTALAPVSVEPFDEGDMIAAARIRAALAKPGRPIGPYDLLIAGQALARGWTVVTANTHEFARIEGLNVIDWTSPAD
jgi:tRNA(fMet)-specific endonuclease VapC